MDVASEDPSGQSAGHASGRFPSGPRGLPLVGDAPVYLADPLKYLLKMRDQYGGIIRLPFGVITMYLVSDPALVEHVLVTDNRSYRKDMYLQRLGREVIGQGLLASEGDFWRRQRR